MGRKRGTGLICLGMLLILGAVSLTGYNCYQAEQAEKTVEQTMAALNRIMDQQEKTASQVQTWNPENPVPQEESEQEYPNYVLNPTMEMPEETIDGWDYIGTLKIPALDLELPIISQWSYPALNVAPARYEGSVYLDNLVIAAHNFSSHFGRIHTLNPGDRLTFTDMEGNVFTYEAAVVETLRPTAVEEMCAEAWDLTLFTCTVGGKFRVTVRCDRTEE